MKLFEFRPNTRSFIDKISGVVPTISSVVFRRLEKGFAAYFSNTADLDGFGVYTGVKSIVMVLKPTADTKLLQDDGTDRIEINGGNIVGTGLTECTVNTVNTDAVSNNIWSLVIAEFSGGIDFSTDLEIDVTADIDIVSVVCYDTILSGLEKGDLWYDFNHMSPTSTPQVIRHKIPVDPTGSVLCHDYQRWNGGLVPDLSGNGHIGQPIGFVDTTIDGAKFPGAVQNYINCGTGGGINGNLTIEALVKKTDIVGNEGIINKGALGVSINYYLGFDGDELYYIVGNGLAIQDTTTTTLNAIADEWYYVVFTVDGSFITSYSNGVQLLQTAQTIIPVSNTNTLFIGALTSNNYPLDGTIKFVKVYPYALTEAKIQANWNKIARLNNLNTIGNNLLPDQKTISANQYIDQGMLVNFGTHKTYEAPHTNSTNLFSAGKGSFETDTESWIPYGTNTIERDITNPFIGTASLKITYVDNTSGAYLTLANVTDLSTNLIVGSWYRITGHARVNTGSVAVYIDGQAAGTTDTYTINSTDWEYFHLDFAAGHITDCRLKMTVMGGTEIIWLDNIVIQEMPPIPQGTKYIQTVTDGDFSFDNNTKAYGEWEFSLYKDDTLNTLTVQFISDSPKIYPNFNGYIIRLDSGEKLTLVKITGGGFTTLFASAHSYTLNVWWDIKVTRSLDGKFHIYSRNTSVGGKYHLAIPSGPTSNPVTDNTFKTSQYGVVEADAGDKIAGFRHRLGVIQ